MTNVVHSTLKQFGKVALSKTNSIDFRNGTTRSKHFDTRSFSSYSKFQYLYGLSYVGYCQLNNNNNKCNKRFVSNDTSDKSTKSEEKEARNEHQQQSSSSSSSSSTFHQYTRKAYEEKKRSSYETNGNHQDNKSNSSSKPDSSARLNLPVNHYQRLNIDTKADLDTIKSAYYSLSKIYHPDIVGNKNESAIENFRLITEAYDTLSDQKQRSDYDRELDRTTNTPMDFWMRPSHPNKDFKIIFRSKDADSMFRFRQDIALEREKLRNPKRFRAGSFSKLDDCSNSNNNEEELQSNLERHIRSINSSSGSTKDGSDFYRMHLSDTIRRRQRDLYAQKNLYGHYGNNASSDSYDVSSLLAALGLVVCVFLVILNIIVEIDLASYLDDRLTIALESKSKKSESESEVKVGAR